MFHKIVHLTCVNALDFKSSFTVLLHNSLVEQYDNFSHKTSVKVFAQVIFRKYFSCRVDKNSMAFKNAYTINYTYFVTMWWILKTTYFNCTANCD